MIKIPRKYKIKGVLNPKNKNKYDGLNKFEDPLWLDTVSSITGTQRTQLKRNAVILLAEGMNLKMDQFDSLKYTNGNCKESKVMMSCMGNIDKFCEMLYLGDKLETFDKVKKEREERHKSGITLSSPLRR